MSAANIKDVVRKKYGEAYGLDITDEMLAPARENQRKAGVANVAFLRARSSRMSSSIATSRRRSPASP